MGESTAVAKSGEKRQTLAQYVEGITTSESARAFIEPFLPPGADARRVAASLMLAMRKDDTGKLKLCTPESLITGVAKIAQWGLELGDGAYLLPFKNSELTRKAKTDVFEATPVRGYQALAEIAAACGYPLEAKVVRQGDHFEYEFGLARKLSHRPIAKNTAPITHVWCIVHRPRNAEPFFDVMTADDVDTIRKKHSRQWKDGPLPAWYAKKTIIRQITKTLPKDPRLVALTSALDEDARVELHAAQEEIAAAAETAQLAAGADDDGFQDDRDLDDDFRARLDRED